MQRQANWVSPSLIRERGEIERTAEALQIDYESLMYAAKKGKLQTLDDATWDRLENTDSQKTTVLRNAKRLAKEYGRDADSIIQGFNSGEPMPAPIILLRKNHAPYLIGGNTRLMIARALKIQPMALIVRL